MPGRRWRRWRINEMLESSLESHFYNELRIVMEENTQITNLRTLVTTMIKVLWV